VQLDGVVALVTGGGSGLGRATAEGLAAAGARVVVLDLPASAGQEVADAVGGAFVPADVADADEVQGAVDRAAELGPLRVAVSCAGIGTAGRVLGRTGPFPLEAFERTLRVNLLGTFNVVRLAAAAMAGAEPVDGERGAIINTASIAAFDGQIGQAAYAASKGGVVGMTLPIARDLAQHLIRVMTIAPGTFLTPMLATLPAPAVEALGAAIPHPSRLPSTASSSRRAASAVPGAAV